MNLVVHSFCSPADASSACQNSYILAYPQLGACAIVDPPCPTRCSETLAAIRDCVELHDYLPGWILHTTADSAQAEVVRLLQQQMLCAQSVLAAPTDLLGNNECQNYDRVVGAGERIQLGNAFGSVQQLGSTLAFVFEHFVFAAQPTDCIDNKKVLTRLAA